LARVSTTAPAAAHGVTLANGGLPSIRVLIADDSSLFRDGLSNLVSTQKDLHVAGTLDSAATANEQIRLIRPDIVLLGWSASAPASQRIFAAILDGKLPTRVIMMVSDDGKEDFVEAIRSGCSGITPEEHPQGPRRRDLARPYVDGGCDSTAVQKRFRQCSGAAGSA
jgi:chemotaxis response regulator CheB